MVKLINSKNFRHQRYQVVEDAYNFFQNIVYIKNKGTVYCDMEKSKGTNSGEKHVKNIWIDIHMFFIY